MCIILMCSFDKLLFSTSVENGQSACLENSKKTNTYGLYKHGYISKFMNYYKIKTMVFSFLPPFPITQHCPITL